MGDIAERDDRQHLQELTQRNQVIGDQMVTIAALRRQVKELTKQRDCTIERIVDEMLLEDPDLSHGTLTRWCARFPEYRDELARFAATLAVQKASPEGPQIDEESVVERLMSYASNIINRQGKS